MQTFFGMWDVVSDDFYSVNPNSPYRHFAFQFQRSSNYMYADHYCGLPDTLAITGYEHMINGGGDQTTGIYMYLYSSNGTSAGSDRNSADSLFQITSVTDIPANTGCHLVRVKGTFNNINYYNSVCGPVPQFTVYQAVFQMDFVNK
jgi:hypothetical protein